MKTHILTILILSLPLISCTGCSKSGRASMARKNIYTLKYFNKMIPPIIVISKGSILGDSRILVRDSMGAMAGFNDAGFNSLKPGDTIIPSIYK